MNHCKSQANSGATVVVEEQTEVEVVTPSPGEGFSTGAWIAAGNLRGLGDFLADRCLRGGVLLRRSGRLRPSPSSMLPRGWHLSNSESKRILTGKAMRYTEAGSSGRASAGSGGCCFSGRTQRPGAPGKLREARSWPVRHPCARGLQHLRLPCSAPGRLEAWSWPGIPVRLTWRELAWRRRRLSPEPQSCRGCASVD